MEKTFAEEVKEKLVRNKILIMPCKNCQQEIILLKEEGEQGRLVAMNMYLERHWNECPGSRQFNKPSGQKRFGNENFKGRDRKKDDFDNVF
jgi:hypothetical protein